LYSISSGFGIIYSKYPDYYINLEFQKFYQGLKLNDIKKPLIMLTYDLENSKPKCFHSYKEADANYNLWEVVRSSTAAPTYFPAYKLDNYTLIDGGIVANNLSELIFIHALGHYGNEEEFFQLSIGTGNYNPKLKNVPSGLWSWSGPIFDVLFSAASTNDMNNLKKLAKFEKMKHFYRLDLNLDDNITLDDYTAFDKMEQIFDKWIVENKNQIDAICEELLKNNVENKDEKEIDV
jgi:hypothetical protein